MAGEHTESEAHGKAGSNGVSSALDDRLAADRAAFLSGNAGDDEGEKTKAKPSKTADDDSDLDEDDDRDDDADEIEDEDDDKSTVDKDEDDPDSDLDEDDDSEKVEPEVAKRLDQVRRTDKRLREQREAHFKEQEAKLQGLVTELEQKWGKRIEAAEQFEQLKSRKHDPIGILKAIGYDDADFADIAREAWAHSPDGAKDPKYKDAIAKTRRERELADKLSSVEKRLEEQAKAEKERNEQATREREVEAFIGKVSKSATEKTPLAQKFLEAEPQAARIELEVIAGRLAQQLGQMPDPKKVMIEFEKSQRRMLRRYGIDPTSLKAAAPSSSTKTETTKAKMDAKKTVDKKTKTEEVDSDKPLSKADFIRAARTNDYD